MPMPVNMQLHISDLILIVKLVLCYLNRTEICSLNHTAFLCFSSFMRQPFMLRIYATSQTQKYEGNVIKVIKTNFLRVRKELRLIVLPQLRFSFLCEL